jgi:hypothetical protein
MKYYLYKLYKGSELVYIGSTTNIVVRMRNHKREKDFESVQWCDVGSREDMLSFEKYLIYTLNPPLNIQKKKPTKPANLTELCWKQMDLLFLDISKVCFDYSIEEYAHNLYLEKISDVFGVSESDLYGLIYHYRDSLDITSEGYFVIKHDGSGRGLFTIATERGLPPISQLIEHIYKKKGKISFLDYEASLAQFD